MSDFSFTIREKFSHIDFFEHTEQDSVLHLSEGANLTYAMFLKNAKITLKVLAESPHVKGQIFVFVAGGQTSLQVETNLQSSHTSVQVHLIAIQGEEDEVQMQGTIDIASWVEKVSGHLLEEVLLLWNAKYISLQPILNVASPDVQASHGAKVHRVPLEKLFYMQSRGFSISTAVAMLVAGYVQQILSHFEVSEEEREQIERFYSSSSSISSSSA